LAGVLLKLGGYGLCRVLGVYTWVLGKFRNLIVRLGLVSLLVVGFICCRLNDIKALVAYSSVAHIGLVVCGLYIGGVLGFEGSLIIIIGHGIASSGLFSILNMYYERTGRRRFYRNRGLILVVPILAFFMFLLCASNIGAPPTINLLSELYLLGRLIGWDWFIVWLLPIGSFIGVVFTIFLFSYRQHGKLGSFYVGSWGTNLVEFNTISLHVIPLNFLVIKFDIFLLWVYLNSLNKTLICGIKDIFILGNFIY
jgi:NADH-ubiquinone oxidoreductase chain 4